MTSLPHNRIHHVPDSQLSHLAADVHEVRYPTVYGCLATRGELVSQA
ncbi:hypothetical protein AB0C47_13380 [Micromonospora taraxaci]